MQNITRISPQEALAKMGEGYTYVDVRSEHEFSEGHPENSVNIPLANQSGSGMMANPDFIAVMKANFPAGSKIILGCGSGGRSMRAAEKLIAEGYTGLFEQRAGWDGARNAFGAMIEPGWGRSGLPSATGADSGAYERMKR